MTVEISDMLNAVAYVFGLLFVAMTVVSGFLSYLRCIGELFFYIFEHHLGLASVKPAHFK